MSKYLFLICGFTFSWMKKRKRVNVKVVERGQEQSKREKKSATGWLLLMIARGGNMYSNSINASYSHNREIKEKRLSETHTRKKKKEEKESKPSHPRLTGRH